MSEAKFFKVKSRLGEMVLNRGGVSAGESIKRAETEVEKTYPKSLRTLDELLVQLDALQAADPADPDTAADHERVYACASRIIDASICMQDSMLDAAARALCDLVDLSAELSVWDAEAVGVHIQALRLLRHAGADMDATARRKLVESLYQVTRKRVGDPEQVASALAS